MQLNLCGPASRSAVTSPPRQASGQQLRLGNDCAAQVAMDFPVCDP